MNDFKFSISVLSWNVRGLGDIKKCAVVKDLIADANPDLICFQETKWEECSIFKLRQVCTSKFRNYSNLDAEGTRGGIVLAWSNSFTLSHTFTHTYTTTVI